MLEEQQGFLSQFVENSKGGEDGENAATGISKPRMIVSPRRVFGADWFGLDFVAAFLTVSSAIEAFLSK